METGPPGLRTRAIGGTAGRLARRSQGCAKKEFTQRQYVTQSGHSNGGSGGSFIHFLRTTVFFLFTYLGQMNAFLSDLHLVGHVVASVGDLFDGYELITVNAVVWRTNPEFLLRVRRTLQLVENLQRGFPPPDWAPSAGGRRGSR